MGLREQDTEAAVAAECNQWKQDAAAAAQSPLPHLAPLAHLQQLWGPAAAGWGAL